MTTPAGWYDDGSGVQRYWDGDAWTEQTRSTVSPGAPSAARAFDRSRARLSSVKGWPFRAKLVAVLALAAVVIGLIVALRSGTSPPSPGPDSFTVSGTVTLSGFDAYGNDGMGSCFGSAMYGTGDITSGAQVTITDPAGKIIGVGRLGVGRQPGSYPSGCVFPFVIANVEAGLTTYGVTIGTRVPVQLAEDDMRAGPDLTLGTGN